MEFLVPRRGLEPPHLAALDPKSSVSTNFTTWACEGIYKKRYLFWQALFIIIELKHAPRMACDSNLC